MDCEEHQLILDIAVMYYLEDMTQSQIAKEKLISRSKVSRLLKKARKKKIVDIKINYDSEAFDMLEAKIKSNFDVETVIITKTLKNEMKTLKEVCKVASLELTNYLRDDLTLGISWGRHLGMTAKYLVNHYYNNIRVIELFGAISYDMNQLDSNSVGRKICNKLNAILYPLPAPVCIFEPDARATIINTPIVKNALEKANECDLILTSIGTMDNDNLQVLWSNYLGEDIKDSVKKSGGVGFILARFFDKNGKFIECEINDSVIGMSVENIHKQNIFAIASGKRKSRPILAALRGGLLQTLVTDEETIRKVLELHEKEKY
ncbi:MAG: hypothetical protein N4A57_08875 [Anaeromicrobium sp.]|jgi:DNA-binding transcriptional regulator LsrR (DeoR family)|uniref:sugar-binding transcriptional regulator n=1 Tax=Anaeromicrobium sp. TaxID=1929132 RepID=UPI0025EDC317|nr:sugar-binding domain-containing protein [Anaeromicrobium sp.]MCT4594364.1 hypothetical protein [Anaeromicrobium sp.]